MAEIVERMCNLIQSDSQEFDGAIETLTFMLSLLRLPVPDSIEPIDTSSLLKPTKKFMHAKPESEEVWPLIEMAEFEFGGIGSTLDMRNIVVIAEIPQLPADKLFLMDRFLHQFLLVRIAEVKSVYLPIDSDRNVLRGTAFVEVNSYEQAAPVAAAVNMFMWPVSGEPEDLLKAPQEIVLNRWRARCFQDMKQVPVISQLSLTAPHPHQPKSQPKILRKRGKKHRYDVDVSKSGESDPEHSPISDRASATVDNTFIASSTQPVPERNPEKTRSAGRGAPDMIRHSLAQDINEGGVSDTHAVEELDQETGGGLETYQEETLSKQGAPLNPDTVDHSLDSSLQQLRRFKLFCIQKMSRNLLHKSDQDTNMSRDGVQKIDVLAARNAAEAAMSFSSVEHSMVAAANDAAAICSSELALLKLMHRLLPSDDDDDVAEGKEGNSPLMISKQLEAYSSLLSQIVEALHENPPPRQCSPDSEPGMGPVAMQCRRIEALMNTIRTLTLFDRMHQDRHALSASNEKLDSVRSRLVVVNLQVGELEGEMQSWKAAHKKISKENLGLKKSLSSLVAELHDQSAKLRSLDHMHQETLVELDEMNSQLQVEKFQSRAIQFELETSRAQIDALSSQLSSERAESRRLQETTTRRSRISCSSEDADLEQQCSSLSSRTVQQWVDAGANVTNSVLAECEAAVMKLKTAREQMQREAKSIAESKQQEDSCCCICQDNAKTILLMPCRHLCVCQECAEARPSGRVNTNRSNANAFMLTSCPVCRTNIASRIKVYS